MSEASEDTRVQIKGTFSVKKAEHNGLNRVAEYMNANRLQRVRIVGEVEFVRHVDTIQGDEMTVALIAVEPTVDGDGKDTHGDSARVGQMLESIRKRAGKSSLAGTLFSAGRTAELDGQLEAIARGEAEGAEAAVTTFGHGAVGVRPDQEIPGGGEVNASGDPVPEKSAAEILAERAEQKADGTSSDKPGPSHSGGVKAAPGGEGDLVTEGGGTGDNVKPIRVARAARKTTTRPATADPFTQEKAPF
jgi:hypothetical protein